MNTRSPTVRLGYTVRWYLVRLVLIALLGGINLFAFSLRWYPHVSDNYRDFYMRHDITLGEYEANEIRGVYTSHQDRWRR
ncbi:hypothetical protein D3W54_07350 [Komagataeibacter medellinensis]|uniref:Uncharacterized protein n=1 Tax=Komagataeibacter medellinensis TaxID=1177712 RepID=A0ABQ6VY50_9PROT|nr:hypothetical protein [Komagataeibacter medellinensis]KAB8124048.1 hypothetical protein D3W54_07350 [Komagataeibacter medellinensis]